VADTLDGHHALWRKLMDRFSLGIALLVSIASGFGCGDDGSPTDASSDTSTTLDTSTADTSTADTSTADTGTADTGTTDTGTMVDANTDAAITGCATSAGPMCPEGLMCCSGVPYPTEGVCQESCPAVSDREAKRDFSPVDPENVLARLGRIEINEWSYRAESGHVRHVGPMAQDFHREFGLGADDRHIHPVDAAGVTIAALQALLSRVEDLERDNTALREETMALRERLESR
jgi:hypothetical protein